MQRQRRRLLGRYMGPATDRRDRAQLQPVTLQSSATHRSAQYIFAAAGTSQYSGGALVSYTPIDVEVGVTDDGQPFVISSQPCEIAGITPDGALVASADFVMGGFNQTGQSFAKNGAMINPWTGAQGADGLLGVYKDGTGQQYATQAYDNALNVDPAHKGQAIPVPFGAEFSVVKFVRRAGMTTPATWRHFDDICVLHVIPPSKRPPLGALAPAPSALDKTCRFSTRTWNKAALGGGFSLSTGMPTLADCQTGDFFRSLQPYWMPGGGADARRRYMINPAVGDDVGGGYSRDYAQKWADEMSATLAQGAAVSNAQLAKLASFGIAQLGHLQRGWPQSSGAGQWNGHWPFAFLVGMLWHEAIPGLMDEVMSIQGNEKSQQYWVPTSFLGKSSGVGNHSINHGVFQRTGYADWCDGIDGGDSQRPPVFNPERDANMMKDYQQPAMVAAFQGLFNCCLMKNGPNGWDGAQVLAFYDYPGNANIGDYWQGSGEQGAAVAFLDVHYSLRAPAGLYNTEPLSSRSVNFYNDMRGNGTGPDIAAGKPALPRYQDVPRALNPQNSFGSPYIHNDSANGNGRIKWDLTGVNHSPGELPILEWQQRIALVAADGAEGRQFIAVTSPGISGVQTGLPNAQTFDFQYRARNAQGWGAWCNNYPWKVGGSKRWRVTTAGAASGTVVFTHSPVLLVPTFPGAPDPIYEAAPSTMDISVNTTLYAGLGMVTGNTSGGFSIKYQRNGVEIPLETGSSYALVRADLGTNLTHTVTCGGVTSSPSPAVAIPSLPPLPATLHFESTFDLSFKLFYEEVWNSMWTHSTGCNPRLVLTGISGTFVLGETITGSLSGATGVVTAWSPGTSRVTVQISPTARFVVGDVLSAPSAATGTVSTIEGGIQILPQLSAVDADENLVTVSIVQAKKQGQFPTLAADYAARKPLTPGVTYRATVWVPVGADGVQPTVDTFVRIGSTSHGVQYCTVTIPATTAHSFTNGSTGVTNPDTGAAGPKITSSGAAQPKQLKIEMLFVAATANFFVESSVNTNTGGTGGGNPAAAYVRLEQA